LEKEVVCAKFAHTTQHGAIEGKQQTKETVKNLVDNAKNAIFFL